MLDLHIELALLIFIYSTSNETQSLPKDPTSSHFDTEYVFAYYTTTN